MIDFDQCFECRCSGHHDVTCSAFTDRESPQPVPLKDCGHPAWACACEKHRDFQEDPADVQHEPVVQEGY